jgi:hypothetical protein
MAVKLEYYCMSNTLICNYLNKLIQQALPLSLTCYGFGYRNITVFMFLSLFNDAI